MMEVQTVCQVGSGQIRPIRAGTQRRQFQDLAAPHEDVTRRRCVGSGRYRPAGRASMVAIMRLRMSASGSRPRPPPRLSAMFFAWLVAGVTTVTAGWLATNLMKNCAHVVASNSLA